MCVVWDCAGGSVFFGLVIAIVMKSWFLQMCFGGFPAMDCLYDGVVYHVFSRTTRVIDTGKNWRIEHFEYRNDGYLFGEFKVLFYYGLFRQNFGTKNRRDECRFEDCLRWEGSS